LAEFTISIISFTGIGKGNFDIFRKLLIYDNKALKARIFLVPNSINLVAL